MNKELERKLINQVKKNPLSLKDIEEQTERICLEAVKKYGNALFYVKDQTPEICLEAVKQNADSLCYVECQTDNICKEALKSNFDGSLHFIIIKEKSTAMIVLKASLRHGVKNKAILTKILNKFSKDKEIIDFYTKHKLWNIVDFSKVKLNDNLIQYGMTI